MASYQSTNFINNPHPRTTFSGAFETGALFKISKPSVVWVIFMNIAIYLVFTLLCFFAARPPAVLARAINPRVADSRLGRRLPKFVRRAMTLRQMSMEETIAVCFCGAAKTTSLGIPLVSAMWAQSDDLTRAFIQIPVLLYTIEQVGLATVQKVFITNSCYQVFVAQMLVHFFKWYTRRLDRSQSDSETQTETEPGIQSQEPPQCSSNTSLSHRDKRFGHKSHD